MYPMYITIRLWFWSILCSQLNTTITIQFTVRVYFDTDKYMHDYMCNRACNCEYNKLYKSIVQYIENNIFVF